MQAYKLNATIDESGHLVIDEPLNIAPGKVEVIIRGRPSLDQFDDFTKQTTGIPGLSFKGPYKNPDDLQKIYSEVHFTWAIDMFEEGLNSSWLGGRSRKATGMPARS